MWDNLDSHCSPYRGLRKKFLVGCELLIEILFQVSRNADHHPAFFAIYDMEAAEFVAFYQVFALSLLTTNKFRTFCS